MSAEKLRIDYMPLDKIQEAPRNPKEHELETIKESMRRFGFVAVPAVNETTGRLVAGHGRKEALLEMQAAGEPAPKRIVVKGKVWLVPVLRGVAFDTDAEAEAYLLADNRLSDIGGYDEKVLAEVLADMQKTVDGLKGTGYNEDDLKALVAFSGTGSGGEEPGAGLPELPGYEPPAQQPRLIIICKTNDDLVELHQRMGLPADPTKITYLYEDIKWEADGVRQP